MKPPSLLFKKIITREKAAELAEKLRKAGKIIGFTSGSFDLLHGGHVDYLEKAKAKCDILFVGINSDASVGLYKGDKRPIIEQSSRLQLIAALASTDYCFLFAERRNRENLLALKPHLYLKATDYDAKSLTSAKLLADWGGKSVFLPFVAGQSSTSIIERILERYADEVPRYLTLPKGVRRPAVFLDRDGVINEEIEYLHEADKFEFLPGALKGIKKLYDKAFKIIVVTTQAGIGLGYFSKEDFYRVNRKMLGCLREADITVEKIYFCPHSKADACPCRKPQTELFRRAQEECHLDFSRSYLVGDKTSDIETGARLHLKTILVETGHGGKDGEYTVKANFQAADLSKAADWIIEDAMLK